MQRLAIVTLLAVLVAGCSGQQTRTAANAPPPRPSAQAAAKPPLAKPPAPAPAPSLAVADPDEALWHLRSGLNVAALSCKGKGRTPVSGAYGRMLGRHRGLLSAAYAAEQRRYGKALDRHLTQLYNRFAFQRSPEGFCASAAAAANEAVAMDSRTLALQARRLLGRLS